MINAKNATKIANQFIRKEMAAKKKADKEEKAKANKLIKQLLGEVYALISEAASNGKFGLVRTFKETLSGGTYSWDRYVNSALLPLTKELRRHGFIVVVKKSDVDRPGNGEPAIGIFEIKISWIKTKNKTSRQ